MDSSARAWIATPQIAADFRGPVDRPFQPMPSPHAIGPMTAALAQVAVGRGDAVAVAAGEGGSDTSFAKLIAGVARIAAAVAARPGRHVAILLPTGAAYVASVFACAAAGRLAVMLDAGYPAARNAAIAAAGAVDLVLTDGNIAVDWPGVAVLDVGPLMAGGPVPPLPAGGDLDAPAFILTTSGSTGLPKLIVHSQATMLHWARTTHNGLHVTPADRCLTLSSMATLGGFTALLSYPLAGATMEIVDLATRGIGGLIEVLGRGQVTIMRGTPSLLRGLAGLPGAHGALAGLRIAQAYGEPLMQADVAALRAVLPADCLVRTTYGSTEASGLSWFAQLGDPQDPLRVPTGVLMPDTQAAIVAEDGSDCPRGTAGELVIRSRYNGLGEWQDDALVPGRLVPDAADPGCRVYATGDVARCDADGVFVVLGRRDRMLNLNGVRVEPAEIERALGALPGVARGEVVVVARGSAQALVGIVVPVAGATLDLADCKRRLRMLLPGAMVPSRLVVADAVPLLPGGKVDTTALQALAAA